VSVRIGSRGEAVVALQKRLNHHGFGPLVEDGDFGRKTHDSVVQFQMAQGLSVDGIVGQNTWSELMMPYEGGHVSNEIIEKAVKQNELKEALLNSDATPIVKAVIGLAIDDLGKRESPSGSNKGADILHLIDGYHEYWKINKSKYPAFPWCAMAVSRWIYFGMGLKSWRHHPFGHFFGGVGQIEDWATQRNKIFTPVKDGLPPIGSIFVMSRLSSGSDASSSTRSGHTGFIVSVDGDRIVTVEGNVKNAVSSMSRKLSDITGYIIWW
jgi:hypothetical protein